MNAPCFWLVLTGAGGAWLIFTAGDGTVDGRGQTIIILTDSDWGPVRQIDGAVLQRACVAAGGPL